MIAVRTWLLALLVLAGVLAVGYSTKHDFKPTAADIKDPLGRPSALSLELIDSAAELDRLTTEMIPKHADLAVGISRMNSIASDLDVLVGDAGELPGATLGLGRSTDDVVALAGPLPSQLEEVTANTLAAPAKVENLGASVEGVSGELELVEANLSSLGVALEPLAGQTASITTVLRRLEKETARIAPLAPLLQSVPAKQLAALLQQLFDATPALPSTLTGLSNLLSSLLGGTR